MELIPGFEPGTSNSRSWRANLTALHPEQVVGGYLFYRVEINGIARVPALVVRAVVAICLQQGPYLYGPLVCYVGIPGFEPGTPCSQSRCANRTALHPDNLIDSGDKSIRKISNIQIFRAFFSKKLHFPLRYCSFIYCIGSGGLCCGIVCDLCIGVLS